MRERVKSRLERLQQEFRAGQAKLRELEITMCRIEGAIMVLEELLGADEPEEERPTSPPGGNGQDSAVGSKFRNGLKNSVHCQDILSAKVAHLERAR